jgi:hypothetical protein
MQFLVQSNNNVAHMAGDPKICSCLLSLVSDSKFALVLHEKRRSITATIMQEVEGILRFSLQLLRSAALNIKLQWNQRAKC